MTSNCCPARCGLRFRSPHSSRYSIHPATCCSDAAMSAYRRVGNPPSTWQLLVLDKAWLKQLFGQTLVVRHCARLSRALTLSVPHAYHLRVLEAQQTSNFRQHPSLRILCIICRKLHVGSCANWMVYGAGSSQWLACKSSQWLCIVCRLLRNAACGAQHRFCLHRFFMMAFINTILDRYAACFVAE